MAAKVKALQQWCKVQCNGYRDVNIVNMTSSWKSGLAFCAMIHRYRPDLIDYDSLSKENVYENNKLAFESASQLGIAALLDPEDMVVMTVPDKLCIITYVSQYYNVLSKLRPATAGGSMAVKRSAASEDHPSVEKKKPVLENSNKHNQASSICFHESSTKDTDTSAKVRTMDDRCSVCGNKVFIVERHMENNKLYHRKCLRDLQKSQSSTLRASQEGVLAMDVTNYDDNVNTRDETLKDTNRTLPIDQDSKSSVQKLPSSQDRKFSDHKLATIEEPMSTESTSSGSPPSKTTNQTPQTGPESSRTVDQVLPKRQDNIQQNISVEKPNCQKATESQNSRSSVQKIQTNQEAVFSNKIPQNNQQSIIPDHTRSKRQDTKTATTSSNSIIAPYSKQSHVSKIESGQSSSSSSANSTPSGTLTRSNSHNSESKVEPSSSINVPNSRPVSMCVTRTFQISNKNAANDSSKNTSMKAPAKDLVVNRSDPNQAERLQRPDKSAEPLAAAQAVRESEKDKKDQIHQNDIVVKDDLSQPVMRSTNRVSVVSTQEAHVSKPNDSSQNSQIPPSKQTSRASWSPAVQNKKLEDGKISSVENTFKGPVSNDDPVPQTICVGKHGDVPTSSSKQPESLICSNVSGTVQPEFVTSNIQPAKRVHPPPNNDGNPPIKFPRETSSGTSGSHLSKVPEKQSVKQPAHKVQEPTIEQGVRPPSSTVQGNVLVARPRSHHPAKNREISQHQRSEIKNKESNNPADNKQSAKTQSPRKPSRSNTDRTVQPTFHKAPAVPHEPELPAKSIIKNPSMETPGTSNPRTGEPGLVCPTPTKELPNKTDESRRTSQVDIQIIQDQVSRPDQSVLNNRVSGASEKSQIDPTSEETTSPKAENSRANGPGIPTSDQSVNTILSPPVSISKDDDTSIKKHPKGDAPLPPTIQTQQQKDNRVSGASEKFQIDPTSEETTSPKAGNSRANGPGIPTSDQSVNTIISPPVSISKDDDTSIKKHPKGDAPLPPTIQTQQQKDNRVSGASEKYKIDPSSEETTSPKAENSRANGPGIPTSDQSVNTILSPPVSISKDDDTSIKKHPKGDAPLPPTIQTQQQKDNRVSGASEKSQIDPTSEETTSPEAENSRANGPGIPTSDQSVNTIISPPVSISKDDDTSIKKHPKGDAPLPPTIQTQQQKDNTSASISNQPQQPKKNNAPATPLSNHSQLPTNNNPPAPTISNQHQSSGNNISAIQAVETPPNPPQSPRNPTPAVTVTAGVNVTAGVIVTPVVTSISSQPKQPHTPTPTTPLSPTPPQRPKDRAPIVPSIPNRPTPGELASASTPKTPTSQPICTVSPAPASTPKTSTSQPVCTVSPAPASTPKTPTIQPGGTVSNVPIPTPRDLQKTPQNPSTVTTEKVPSHSDRTTNDLAVMNDVINQPQDGIPSTVCSNDKLPTPVPSRRNAKTKMANSAESEKENKQKITDNKEPTQDQVIVMPARPPPPAHPPNRLASPSSSFNSNDKPVLTKSNSRSSTSDDLLSPPPRPKPPNPENVEKCKRKITPDVKFTFDDEKLTFPCAVARSSSRTTKGLEPSAINHPVVRRKVIGEDRLANEYIVQQLNFIDMRLKEMEKEGRLLEEKIRSSSDDSMDDDVDLMVLWFDMINCRNELVREESDLIYRCRQQELEDTHSNVEYELRRLMAKPDHLKTDADRKNEEDLLKKLLETVSMRSSIVDCMEEDRLRYLKEDEELAKTKSAKVLTTGSDTKKPEKKKSVFYNNDEMLY